MGQDPAPAADAGVDGIEHFSSAEEFWFPDEWYQLADPGHFWLQWRLGATLRQIRKVAIPVDQPLRVLEVGGGTGVLREQLESRTRWTIDITDLHPAALRGARKGRGRNLCYNVREEQAAFVGAYDVVVLFDVLEHIDPPGPFVRSLLRHIRDGGHLLLNVPALHALFSAYDTAAGHLRRYDKRTLAAEFAGTGLEIRDLCYWGLWLVPVLFARKLLLRRDAAPSEIIRSGFCPPGPVADAVLRGLMRLESAVSPRPPLGTSLLLAGQKRRP